MAFASAFLLLLIFALISLSQSTLPTSSQSTSPASLSPLLAPLHRNVTSGQAWTYPPKNFSIAARNMDCECFDPSQKCCMPVSSLASPFCTPMNATCCGDTFCLPGETCCGTSCCSSSTTCNLKLVDSGCCPVNAVCGSSPTCYDYTSLICPGSPVTTAAAAANDESQTSRSKDPDQECCPATLPYCRSFPPNGIGCYASESAAYTLPSHDSAHATTVSVTTSPTPISLHYLVKVPPSTQTLTISIDQDDNRTGGLALLFPSLPPTTTTSIPTGPFPSAKAESAAVVTTYVIAWPTISPPPPPPSSPLSTPSFSVTPTPPEPSTTSTKTRTPSGPSHLCFDPTRQTPAACPPASTTTTTTITTSQRAQSTDKGNDDDDDYAPPGASIYINQARRIQAQRRIALTGLVIVDALSLAVLLTVWMHLEP